MTAKEYLEQVQKLEYKIKRMKQRSEEYDRMSLSISGTNYDGVRVDGTRNYDAPFVKWIIKKHEVDSEIEKLEDKLMNLKADILLQVEAFENDDYKNLIVMHYLNGLTWNDIADKLYVVKRTVLRWNEAALELINVPCQKVVT